jgi:hypothetical protein
MISLKVNELEFLTFNYILDILKKFKGSFTIQESRLKIYSKLRPTLNQWFEYFDDLLVDEILIPSINQKYKLNPLYLNINFK